MDKRAVLLDAAERLLLREGYAHVTSRAVAAEAQVKPSKVHYYYKTMDDLYVAVYRRRADEGIARFRLAMEVDPSLRTIWRFGTDLEGAAFHIELAALANHRKPIRDEMAKYAKRFRDVQLDAVTETLARQGISPDVCPPRVVLIAMTGVTQYMAIEKALGMTEGHDEVLEFANDWLDHAEQNLSAAAAVGQPAKPRRPAKPAKAPARKKPTRGRS